MRILVIQTAFIGDVVLTTPFIESLRQRWPQAEIHVVTTPAGAEVLSGIRGVFCHRLQKRPLIRGLRVLLGPLRQMNFTMVFCVHRSLRSLWIGRQVKATVRVGFSSFWARVLGYQVVPYPQYSEGVHYADKPMALLRVCEPDAHRSVRPVLEVAPIDEKNAKAKLAVLNGREYIALSPFSAWGTKMWFSDRFAQLGKQLVAKYGKPIVVIGSGGAREQIIAKTIVEKIGEKDAVSLVGQTSLGELKAVVKRASFLVANDSAPIHIAAAFDVPTVAIFGPTVKKWGFFPLSTRSAVVEKEVSCRPCSLHGPQSCPKKHFRCMDEIRVEDVSKAVEHIVYGPGSA